MDDADLRSPARDGFRPSGPEPGPAQTRWWEPLATKWGVIGILIFIGLAMGVIEGIIGRMAETKTPDQKSEIRKTSADASLRPAIDAMYADPTYEKERAAVQAIESYRRSFPDATPETLQEPSAAKHGCTSGMPVAICKDREDNQRRLAEVVAGDVRINFATSLRQDLKYRASVVETLARDRRVTAQQATARLRQDRERMKYENHIRAILDTFQTLFVDGAAKGTYEFLSDLKSLPQFFQNFRATAAYSLAPLMFYDECPKPQAPPHPDVDLCVRAVKKYQEIVASNQADPQKRSMNAQYAAKYTAIKTLLEERAAPSGFIEKELLKPR